MRVEEAGDMLTAEVVIMVVSSWRGYGRDDVGSPDMRRGGEELGGGGCRCGLGKAGTHVGMSRASIHFV